MRSTHLTTFLFLFFAALAVSLTIPLPGRSLARAVPLEIFKREPAIKKSSSGKTSSSKISNAASKIKSAAAKQTKKKASKPKALKNNTSAGITTHGDAPAGMAIVVAGTVVGILVLGGVGGGL